MTWYTWPATSPGEEMGSMRDVVRMPDSLKMMAPSTLRGVAFDSAASAGASILWAGEGACHRGWESHGRCQSGEKKPGLHGDDG
jgi:hypothetical protein